MMRFLKPIQAHVSVPENLLGLVEVEINVL